MWNTNLPAVEILVVMERKKQKIQEKMMAKSSQI